MVKIIPHLILPNANKAIALYTDLFGAKLISHTPHDPKNPPYFGFPANFDFVNSTLHAEISINGALIYFTDYIEGMEKKVDGNQVEILLDLDSQAQIEEIWKKVLVHKFKIGMTLQPMFWGAIYGSFIDSENIRWQLNFTLPQPPTTPTVKKKSSKKSTKKK
jgi:PhnB protein